MRIGKNMKHCLDFLRKYGINKWITYAKDRPTINAVKKLEENRLVKTNKFHQVKLIK